MSDPAVSSSSADGDFNLRQVCSVVLKLLDLSLNAKENLVRCLVDPSHENAEEMTVFVSVYHNLYHAEWQVSVSEEVSNEQLKTVEKVRGNINRVRQIVESCQGSIMKEFDLINHLNCELFFAKIDKTKLDIVPAYFYFNKMDDFYTAILESDFSSVTEVPEVILPEMEKHIKVRTVWAKRHHPKSAHCKVIAIVHYDGFPKDIVTFHSKTE